MGGNRLADRGSSGDWFRMAGGRRRGHRKKGEVRSAGGRVGRCVAAGVRAGGLTRGSGGHTWGRVDACAGASRPRTTYSIADLLYLRSE